jgi:hypothetical protein
MSTPKPPIEARGDPAAESAEAPPQAPADGGLSDARDRQVDLSGEGSFPASDPPSWWGGR